MTSLPITTIRDHELAHVNFLKSAISAAGGTPIGQPVFDFTGGNGSGNGPFAGAFADYELFLAVAQVLEDTGVRAYKGQAGNLIFTVGWTVNADSAVKDAAQKVAPPATASAAMGHAVVEHRKDLLEFLFFYA